MKSILKSPYKNYFLLGLLVFIITAYFSEGYHNPDEHFQVLEFCNYKLGNSPSSDLPWEFKGGDRQAIQPSLAFVIIKALNLINIHNPFTYAFVLRLLAALISWYFISKMCLLLLPDFSSEASKRIFVLLNLFLWFIPYASVRFSGENFSGITFLAAVYLILSGDKTRNIRYIITILLSGFLLALSFYFRFQTGFAIIGLGLWLLLIKKPGWQNVFTMGLAFILGLGICASVDIWFYGRFEFTPYNYFQRQIVENISSHWGTFPWWYYFQLVFLQAVPPISIFLILFFFWGAVKKTTNIFFWAILPFLAIHFWVGYKEIRYLFPMQFGFIYLIAIGVDAWIQSGKLVKAGRIVLYILIILNIPLLLIRVFIPAQEAVKYYKFLYHYSAEKEITLLCKEKSIYELVGYEMNFYKSKNVHCIVLQNDSDISNYLQLKKPDTVFLLERNLKKESSYSGYDKENAYCLFPDWVLLHNINDWESRARIWNIVKLKIQK